VSGLAIGHLDPRTEAYVEDVLAAIEAQVPIVEAYLIGSAAVGGFDPRTSDVDLVVVVERGLGEKRRIIVEDVAALRCPVRDLELVVYVEGARAHDFDLNLNRGEETEAEPFWFVLDAAVAQEQAVPLLHERAWTDLFEPISDEQIREAVCELLAWSERRGDDFARVTAERARHYLERGDWISKAEAQR
jgi:predicted nucleotidyltransferase